LVAHNLDSGCQGPEPSRSQFVIPSALYLELAEVVVEMFRLKLARELSVHRAEAWIRGPCTIDGPTHELRDQCLASGALCLEVILASRDCTLVRRRGLGPRHVDQEELHDRRGYGALLRRE